MTQDAKTAWRADATRRTRIGITLLAACFSVADVSGSAEAGAVACAGADTPLAVGSPASSAAAEKAFVCLLNKERVRLHRRTVKVIPKLAADARVVANRAVTAGHMTFPASGRHLRSYCGAALSCSYIETGIIWTNAHTPKTALADALKRPDLKKWLAGAQTQHVGIGAAASSHHQAFAFAVGWKR
jgi:hypothetical protein